VENSAQSFAQNRLVVIYPVGNRAGLTSLQDLAKPGLRIVLAANAVPVGQYSLDFLQKTQNDTAFPPGFRDQFLNNVVSYEDNVKVVFAKVALGEADAGIVYSSDATGGNAAQVGVMTIPDTLNVIAQYPIATVAGSRSPELAQAFVEYVMSPKGQKILSNYGFLPIDG
jgi:molybdate transport system substrate-binding protein